MFKLESDPNPSPLCTYDRGIPEPACRLIFPDTLPSQPLSFGKPALIVPDLHSSCPLWQLSSHGLALFCPCHCARSEEPLKEGPMSSHSDSLLSPWALSWASRPAGHAQAQGGELGIEEENQVEAKAPDPERVRSSGRLAVALRRAGVSQDCLQLGGSGGGERRS